MGVVWTLTLSSYWPASACVVAAMAWGETWTTLGLQAAAIGDNERVCGFPVRLPGPLVKMTTYVISGCTAALAGVI